MPFSSTKAFLKRKSLVHPLFHVSRETRAEAMLCYSKNEDDGDGMEKEKDVWDVWSFFRFGFDVCELRNER